MLNDYLAKRPNMSMGFFGQMSEIGARLREERKRLGLNQTEFGALGGVSLDAQSNYESGKRNPDTTYLAAIAAASADVQYIITGTRSATCVESALSLREACLLDNYRHCDEEGRAFVDRLVHSTAQSRPEAEVKRSIRKI